MSVTKKAGMSETQTLYRIYYTDSVHWPAIADGRDPCRFTRRHWSGAQKLRSGELLVAYMRGEGAFCGVLEVTGPAWLGDDAEYPVVVPVAPVVILDAAHAVSVKDDRAWAVITQGADVQRGPGWIGKLGLRNDMGKLRSGVGAGLLALLREAYEPATQRFDPAEVEDTRAYMSRKVKERHGQGAFRQELLAAYAGRCPISGCDVPEALEAAHITPHLGVQSQVLANGLLLRADIHALFDCGLMAVDPMTMTIAVAKSLMRSAYADYHGRRLAAAADPGATASKKALGVHFAAANLEA